MSKQSFLKADVIETRKVSDAVWWNPFTWNK
jgi:hypothetical protein